MFLVVVWTQTARDMSYVLEKDGGATMYACDPLAVPSARAMSLLLAWNPITHLLHSHTKITSVSVEEAKHFGHVRPQGNSGDLVGLKSFFS